MGKRSNFARNPRDWYPTPEVAVFPLLPFLPDNFEFSEPFAGDGVLIDHLEKAGGKCLLKSDIEPLRADIQKKDFFEITYFPAMVITNSPWDRKILHPLIDHLIFHTDEFWLLFDASWPFTKQSSPYMEHCSDMVAIGRLKWIPDSKMTGKDDCAWYKFTKSKVSYTKFHGR
jgi:hypothetical protein